MEWFTDWWNRIPSWEYNVFLSIVVIIFSWALRYFGLKLVFNNIEEVRERYYWKNGVKYTTFSLGLILIGSIWVSEVDSFATFFGLVSAGLTIALKDPIVNIAGWLFIIIRKPFEVGDRVQIGDQSGDIIDIRVFQFTINEIGNWVDADQSTGRIIHIPNGKVFIESQTNYTQGFSHIWNELGVLVTFESNWQQAKKILWEIADRHCEHFTEKAAKKLLDASKKYMIFYNNLDPIVYTDVKDSGVMLTMRYLCVPNKRRGSTHKIWEDVLEEFAKHDDIDFAYPTQRIYYNLKEGKDGARKTK